MASTGLSAPNTIDYQFIDLGNIVKIDFSPVAGAYSYAIEKYDEVLDDFVLLGITRTNEFIDHSNPSFSTDSNTIIVKYRIATLGTESDIIDEYSEAFTVNIPTFPSEYRNLVEREIANSDIALVTGNKEDKLVYQGDNVLNFKKFSTIYADETKNEPELFLNTEVFGSVRDIKNSNDGAGFFVRYSSGTIIKYNQSTLFPMFTLPTLNRNIFDFDFNPQGSLVGVLEDVLGQTQIQLYDVQNNIVKSYFSPIIIKDVNDKNIKIVDFKIVYETIFILDEYGVVTVFSVNFENRQIVLENKLFKEERFKKEYNHFLKRSSFAKKIIYDFLFNFSTVITDPTEKDLIATLLLNENPQMYTIINNYRDDMMLDAETGTILEPAFKSKSDLFITSIINLLETYDINTIDSVVMSSFLSELLLSDVYNIYVSRNYHTLEKMWDAVDNFDDSCKLFYSDIQNHMIISSNFFFRVIDLEIYKVGNIIDTVSPNNFTPNYSVPQIYTSGSGSDFFDALLYDQVDRFITKVEMDDSMRNVAIYFDDIMCEPLYNGGTGDIEIDYSFEHKYIDFYKLDISSVFERSISNSISKDLDYTFFKGFGYPIVYNFSNFSSIFEDNFYFHSDKAYKCLSNRLSSDRTITDINLQLQDDITNGYLEEVVGFYKNAINFVSRINVTSKSDLYTTKREFSFFENFDSEIVTIIDPAYTFLTGQLLYSNSDNYKGTSINFKFDKFSQTCMFISNGDEPGGDKTIGCFYLKNTLYPDINITLTPELEFSRVNYIGNTNGNIVATDEAFMFAFPMTVGATSYIYYFSANLYEMLEEQTRKIEVISPNTPFFSLSAIYIEGAIAIDDENPPIKIYNDYQSSKGEFFNYYGNSEISTWRWEIDYDVILEDDYEGFRVSVDKEPWVYLPKIARSYTGLDYEGDGSHSFFIQYQRPNGTWSQTYSAYYNLKTLRPSSPILLKSEVSTLDRGKFTLYWSKEPDITHFEVIYNNNIRYQNILTPYHSPAESFSSFTTNIENIPVNVIAFDKYGNASEPSNWFFAVNSHVKEPMDVSFDRYTNNIRPTITWLPKQGETLTSFFYRFDNQTFTETADLFAVPENALEKGVHSFEIYGKDSLGNETEKNIYYFEISTDNPNTPVMTEETINRTLYTSPSNLYFNFQYDQSNYKSFYSFDNFVNEFEFKGFYLNITDKVLPSGNNTIYVRYLDKFNNFSETLEYTFYLNKEGLLPPQFKDVDTNTSNKRPTWIWSLLSRISFTEGEFYKDGELLFTIENINSNSWTPNYELSNGLYTLSLIGYDDFGNESKPSTYSININDALPSTPSLVSSNIFGNSANFQFSVPTDGYLYAKLIEFQNRNSHDITSIRSDSNGRFFFKELKDDTSYILEVINYGHNSVFSEPHLTYFSVKTYNEITKLIYVKKGDLEIGIRYFLDSGEYKIESIKDFNYDSNFVIIDGVEYSNNLGIVGPINNNIGFKTDVYQYKNTQ